ncbi:MAG: helix-turn-helix domain-containing protein [Pseudomonadota bacterium]
MTSFSANRSDRAPAPLCVVFVVYPEIALLDLAGPLQVLAWAERPGSDVLGYEVVIASRDGGRVETDTLLAVDTVALADVGARPIDTLIIVGGDGAYVCMKDAPFVEAVAALADQSRRVCSICSGALVLAATGLLDGRRAVTHWEDCAALIDAFPNVRVEVDPIYIKDGHIWTSAGVTAGTDMALAMVAEDLGQDAALKRARSLVTYMVRPGGQSQFSPALERQRQSGSARFERLHQWIAEHLKHNLRVERLAEQENMSVRSFHRLYTAATGATPAKAVEAMRVEAAREQLETTARGVKVVAARCGFHDEERMRRAFMRQVSVSPSDYRQRFRMG